MCSLGFEELFDVPHAELSAVDGDHALTVQAEAARQREEAF